MLHIPASSIVIVNVVLPTTGTRSIVHRQQSSSSVVSVDFAIVNPAAPVAGLFNDALLPQSISISLSHSIFRYLDTGANPAAATPMAGTGPAIDLAAVAASLANIIATSNNIGGMPVVTTAITVSQAAAIPGYTGPGNNSGSSGGSSVTFNPLDPVDPNNPAASGVPDAPGTGNSAVIPPTPVPVPPTPNPGNNNNNNNNNTPSTSSDNSKVIIIASIVAGGVVILAVAVIIIVLVIRSSRPSDPYYSNELSTVSVLEQSSHPRRQDSSSSSSSSSTEGPSSGRRAARPLPTPINKQVIEDANDQNVSSPMSHQVRGGHRHQPSNPLPGGASSQYRRQSTSMYSPGEP